VLFRSKLYFLLISVYLIEKSSACITIFSCEHDGKFDYNTCACDCFPAYSGPRCEITNCDLEPVKCQLDFSPELCASQPVLRSYCPKMCNQPECKCGFDSCLNGGYFYAATCTCFCATGFTGTICETSLAATTPTTTTNAPTTTTTACPQSMSCQNGAKQSRTSCKCDCFPAYTGTLCETLICANEPSRCKDTSVFFFFGLYRAINCALLS